MRNLLGGKGANLAEMISLGTPTTGIQLLNSQASQHYEDGRKITDEIMAQIMDAIVKLEEITGKKFEIKKIRCSFPYVPSKSFYAWYDGYNPQPWIKRRS